MAHLDVEIFAHSSLQKKRPNRTDCEDISCAQPSSDQPTDVGIQVWTLSGLFQSLSLIPVNPFCCCSGCVLWVIAVLKDDVPLSNRRPKVLCQHQLVTVVHV